MRCFCFLHCYADKLWDGTTAYEKRFGTPFKGPLIPFGAEVDYKPSSKKVINEMHPFGSKLLPSIFSDITRNLGASMEATSLLLTGKI